MFQESSASDLAAHQLESGMAYGPSGTPLSMPPVGVSVRHPADRQAAVHTDVLAREGHLMPLQQHLTSCLATGLKGTP